MQKKDEQEWNEKKRILSKSIFVKKKIIEIPFTIKKKINKRTQYDLKKEEEKKKEERKKRTKIIYKTKKKKFRNPETNN